MKLKHKKKPKSNQKHYFHCLNCDGNFFNYREKSSCRWCKSSKTVPKGDFYNPQHPMNRHLNNTLIKKEGQ